MYHRLAGDDYLSDLWKNYQVELSKNINVPGIVSKLFRNRLFRMVVNILLSTIDKNDGIEDENNKKILKNVLTKNQDLNDQKINCHQIQKVQCWC